MDTVEQLLDNLPSEVTRLSLFLMCGRCFKEWRVNARDIPDLLGLPVHRFECFACRHALEDPKP